MDDQEKIRLNLLDNAFELVANKLNEDGIHWWLTDGSLLGAVRGGKRIEWDKEYDVGYMVEDAPKILKSLLNIDGLMVGGNLMFTLRMNNGYDISTHPHIDLNGKRIRVIENKFMRWINAGAFFIYPFLRSLPLNFQILLIKLCMKTYSLIWIAGDTKDYSKYMQKEMGDIYCQIPTGYKKILAEIYGKDYMIPNSDPSNCFDGMNAKDWRKNRKEELNKLLKTWSK